MAGSVACVRSGAGTATSRGGDPAAVPGAPGVLAVISADPTLARVVGPVAAAAGLTVRSLPLRTADAAGAGLVVPAADWARATAVLVGAEVAPQLASAALPRRDGVLVAATDDPPPAVWAAALALGAERVVGLPAARGWLADRLAVAAYPQAKGRVLALLGGCGGAGTSVLAASVAVTAHRRGLPALLVDVDPLGGGADLVLGGEDAPGLRWAGLGDGGPRLSPAALWSALPVAAGVRVLAVDRSAAAPPATAAVTSVLAAARQVAELTVLDVPRGQEGSPRAALLAADEVALVVPATLRAAAAAAATLAWAAVAGEVHLVVRCGPGAPLPPQQVARALGLPLVAVVRGEPGLARGLDRGEPPAQHGRSPLARAAGRLVDMTGAGR